MIISHVLVTTGSSRRLEASLKGAHNLGRCAPALSMSAQKSAPSCVVSCPPLLPAAPRRAGALPRKLSCDGRPWSQDALPCAHPAARACVASPSLPSPRVTRSAGHRRVEIDLNLTVISPLIACRGKLAPGLYLACTRVRRRTTRDTGRRRSPRTATSCEPGDRSLCFKTVEGCRME